MSAPALQQYIQGKGSVPADGLNTFEQTCDTVAQLRAFIGLPGIQVFMRGYASPNDGGQGNFYWNAGAINPADDGVNTIIPTGASSGCWSRLANLTSGPLVSSYSYQVPVTGFSITIPNAVNVLALNPAGALASGAVIMPASPFDGQSVAISSTQAISTFSVSANSGQTLKNTVVTLAAGGVVKWIYAAPQATWFRA